METEVQIQPSEAPTEEAAAQEEPAGETLTEETGSADGETVIDQQIDYTDKLDSIITSIERLETAIEEYGSESYLDSCGIGFIEGRANLNDIFSVLFLNVIFMGLIFGSLLFRHFRK
ncbi:MAG: hypothetical protein K2N29_06175 [Ruminiclostridium sp.]|nr:hypothetical protein [Ruminiclostridium sp.]